MTIDLPKLLANLNSPADWTGLRLVEESSDVLQVRDERLDAGQSGFDRGLMVEVLHDGQFAYAGTNDPSLNGAQRALERALDQAAAAAKRSLFPFSPTQRPKVAGSFHSPEERVLDADSVAELGRWLVQSTRKMNVSNDIVSRVGQAMMIRTSVRFVSSNGSDVSQTYAQNYLDLMVTAQRNGITQTRSIGELVGQAGFEFFDPDTILSGSERISREVLELLEAENCPSETMDLILAPDQLYLQVHESIGHPLELDRILGDERNYAGWSFVNPEDFGTLQYGSELLNVTFDPTISSELASYRFDDTGAEAQREYIIKQGILQRGLGSLESQARTKVPGVACARATSWNRPPIDRMANLNIEPGDSTVEEMIASVERGIFMETNKSWSIDDYRNKFQFGCEYARLIEDGKITRTVKNPNYRGICTPFWNKLKMVGNRESFEVFGSFYCGKGEPNQIIRVGHAVPVCLFENVEVFGGVQ